MGHNRNGFFTLKTIFRYFRSVWKVWRLMAGLRKKKKWHAITSKSYGVSKFSIASKIRIRHIPLLDNDADFFKSVWRSSAQANEVSTIHGNRAPSDVATDRLAKSAVCSTPVRYARFNLRWWFKMSHFTGRPGMFAGDDWNSEWKIKCELEAQRVSYATNILKNTC